MGMQELCWRLSHLAGPASQPIGCDVTTLSCSLIPGPSPHDIHFEIFIWNIFKNLFTARLSSVRPGLVAFAVSTNVLKTLIMLCTDMIFVKNFTRPEFLGPRFYPKKRVNRDNGKFTTKQRKFFKLLNLRQNSVMLQYNILANIQLSQEMLGQLKISQDE